MINHILNHVLNLTLAICFIFAAELAFKMFGALAFLILVPAAVMLVCLIRVTAEEEEIDDAKDSGA